MIQPIQRGVSTDSDKIGGVTLDEYEKSKKIAMDHFITETSAPEGMVSEINNINGETTVKC